MNSIEPQTASGNPGLLAMTLTAAIAFCAFVAGFFGRLIGLCLVAWDIVPGSIDPDWPIECALAGPLTLIALTAAIILRKRSGRSRPLHLIMVSSIVTLAWSLFLGTAFLFFDGGSV